MANDPFLCRPFLLVAAHPEQVHEPVEVALEVGRLHAREPPDVAPDPGAQVVDQLHVEQVLGVGGVGPVALVHEPELPHQGAVRPLAVVDDRGARHYV